MKEIFQEYGGILITVVAIVALIAIIGILVKDGGVVHEAFSKLITDFVSNAKTVAQSTQATQVTPAG
jgi:hypothetical protein